MYNIIFQTYLMNFKELQDSLFVFV